MSTTALQYSWRTISKYFSIFVITAGFFVTVLLAQATLLALISKFTYPLIIGSIVVSAVFSIILFLKIKNDSVFLPRITIASFLLTFLVLLLLIYFPHDTFGGRDEAGYANYAVYISKHGTRNIQEYPDNQNQQYAQRLRSTLPAYPSWLALNNMLFGTHWMLRSNSILIGLGLIMFFLVASDIGGSLVSLLSIILFVSSMPFLWFSRETMTENLSFILLWYMLLIFFVFIKTRRLIYIFLLIITGWLFALTRIEGFFIQLILFVILFIFIFIKQLLHTRYLQLAVCIYLIVSIAAVFTLMTRSLDLYVLPTVNSIRNDIEQIVQRGTLARLPKSSLYRNFPKFTLNMLQKYNYQIAIGSIFLYSLFIVLNNNQTKYLKFKYGVILLALTPEYIKLINPGVSLDQPWLYRRFFYAIFPFAYFSLSLFLLNLIRPHQKRLLIISICFLFIINLNFSRDILFVRNNWSLYDSLSSVTEVVTNKDLIIIRNTTLGYYYSASYLLLQKDIRSVYSSTVDYTVFTLKEKKFNGVPYDRIYLLSNQKENEFFPFILELKASIPINYQQLVPQCQLYLLGRQLRLFDVYNYSRINYNEAHKFCADTNITIKKYNETLHLYELKYH